MSLEYSASSRTLQDRHDTRRLADRLVAVTVHDRFTPEDRAFIERMDMLFLATVDATGQPTCSYKGGDPGFVTLLKPGPVAIGVEPGELRNVAPGEKESDARKSPRRGRRPRGERECAGSR